MADIEEATITTTGAEDDDRAEEDQVKNRPADKLLKVERGWDVLRTKPAMVSSIIKGTFTT